MCQLFNIFRCCDDHEEYDQYYNDVLDCYMYKKECPKCKQLIYMFDKREFIYHVQTCRKFNLYDNI